MGKPHYGVLVFFLLSCILVSACNEGQLAKSALIPNDPQGRTYGELLQTYQYCHEPRLWQEKTTNSGQRYITFSCPIDLRPQIQRILKPIRLDEKRKRFFIDEIFAKYREQTSKLNLISPTLIFNFVVSNDESQVELDRVSILTNKDTEYESAKAEQIHMDHPLKQRIMLYELNCDIANSPKELLSTKQEQCVNSSELLEHNNYEALAQGDPSTILKKVESSLHKRSQSLFYPEQNSLNDSSRYVINATSVNQEEQKQENLPKLEQNQSNLAQDQDQTNNNNQSLIKTNKDNEQIKDSHYFKTDDLIKINQTNEDLTLFSTHATKQTQQEKEEQEKLLNYKMNRSLQEHSYDIDQQKEYATSNENSLIFFKYILANQSIPIELYDTVDMLSKRAYLGFVREFINYQTTQADLLNQDSKKYEDVHINSKLRKTNDPLRSYIEMIIPIEALDRRIYEYGVDYAPRPNNRMLVEVKLRSLEFAPNPYQTTLEYDLSIYNTSAIDLIKFANENGFSDIRRLSELNKLENFFASWNVKPLVTLSRNAIFYHLEKDGKHPLLAFRKGDQIALYLKIIGEQIQAMTSKEYHLAMPEEILQIYSTKHPEDYGTESIDPVTRYMFGIENQRDRTIYDSFHAF